MCSIIYFLPIFLLFQIWNRYFWLILLIAMVQLFLASICRYFRHARIGRCVWVYKLDALVILIFRIQFCKSILHISNMAKFWSFQQFRCLLHRQKWRVLELWLLFKRVEIVFIKWWESKLAILISRFWLVISATHEDRYSVFRYLLHLGWDIWRSILQFW